MSTIHCPGGHTFSDGEIPSSLSFHLIPDVSIETLVSDVINAVHSVQDVEAVVTHKLLSSSIDVYKCPHCDRVLIFWNGQTNRSVSYRPESE